MRAPRFAWPAVAIALALGLLAIIVRLAWVSDDAYITLRTVDNWLAGHGPNWNVAERVQTYTHPLWMLLLALGIGLTGESFYTTLALGGLLSLLAALLLALRAGRLPAAAAVLALLLVSRAFTDYATSGLETPLASALLVAFAGVATPAEPRLLRLFLAALLAALLATTRMDFALLAGPALLASAAGLPRLRAAGALALGLLPFAAWCAFATLYYGTPFPVTAYAKAFNTGIPAIDLLQQGLHYLRHTLATDPVTLAVVAAGAGLGLALRSVRARALALGVLLYCGYVVRVGGDFMQGRFFVPPFVAALAIVARALAARPPAFAAATLAAACALLFAPGAPCWLRAPAADQPPQTADHGIIDERCFYYWQQGLLSPQLDVPRPGLTSKALRAAGRDRPIVVTHGQIGRYAYEAGDLVHFVDPWLCDPLLMRLPTWNAAEWRIGHFIRRLPEGYLETLATGENRIVHPGLHRYYDALRTVMRAPVFDRDRLAVAWRMLRGDYDGDLATYVRDDYHHPPRVAVDASELRSPLPDGVPWFDEPRARLIYGGGLAVRFRAPTSGRALRVRLTGDVRYTFRFRNGDRQLGFAVAETHGVAGYMGDPTLHEIRVEVPAEVGPFDQIWIDAPSPTSEQVAGLGGLVLEP